MRTLLHTIITPSHHGGGGVYPALKQTFRILRKENIVSIPL